MSSLRRILVMLALCCAACARGREETVKITLFELNDGNEIQALRYTTLETDGVTQYTITQIDGRKIKLTGAQIASQREAMLFLRDLPESTRLLVKQAEEAKAEKAADTKDDGQMPDPLRKALITAKVRENEASATVTRLTNELTAGEAAVTVARATVKDREVQLSKARAELDETPKEHSDRRKQLAVKAAGLKDDRDAAKDSVAQAEKRVDALRKDLKHARSRLDSAKAETARLYAQLPDAKPAP